MVSFCLLAILLLSGAAAKPNLIAIVTDDQGQWALGAYGNKDIHTPNLDRLANEGALFTRAFAVTPVCSPSRATYMTGLYPTEHGISDYLHKSETNVGLRFPIWPQVLQKHGYKTSLVGKWHLGHTPQFHPTKFGFDEFMGFLVGGTGPKNPVLETNGEWKEYKGFLTDVLTDHAVDFVKRHKSQPFALCLHYRSPHRPYLPVPKKDSDLYKNVDVQVPKLPGMDIEELKQSTRDYYASITGVDRGVGALMKCLEDEGLAANTLIFFTSDHGYNEGRHQIDTKGNGQWWTAGVRGPKRPNMWDTSLLAPLLVRWPAVIKPGSKYDDIVSTLDMYRTVLGALDLPVPADSKAHGRDFSPLFRGGKLPEHGPFFGQYDLHNGGLAFMRMIRTNDYKYVRYFKANFLDELYDLRTDPGETKNLLNNDDSELPIAKELKDQLTKWQESIGDPVRE